jgi:Subtilase family
MSELPHLRLEGVPDNPRYRYAGGYRRNVKFDLPARNQPVHAQTIREELEKAATDAANARAGSPPRPGLVERRPEGMVLTFESDPGRDLDLKALERLSHGIRLLSVTVIDGVTYAKVFVPEGELIEFLRLVDRYAAGLMLTFQAEARHEDQLKGFADEEKGISVFGRTHRSRDQVKVSFQVPEAEAASFEQLVSGIAVLTATTRRNANLIDSIARVRLALVTDFWQDTIPFPAHDQQMWWEVWLHGNRQEANEVHARFTEFAHAVGIDRVSEQHVAFPERVVLHALASARQLSDIDLMAMIAELRKAKELATAYVQLSPRDQRDFVDDVVSRLVLPGPDAPSVCILDGGVNRAHPLIEPVLAPADTQAVDPAWGTHDHDSYQHGTGMAGTALYGCLTQVLNRTEPIALRHRLESVKILPPPPQFNEPPVYGWITQQAAAKAQIQAPRRNRVLCMAVTADDRDMGECH